MESRESRVFERADLLLSRVSNFQFLISSFLSRVSALVAHIPWRVMLAAAFVVLVLVGLRERDARLRRVFELQQLRQQTAAQIADLRARAEGAVRDAAASARRIQDLEARRQRLEREEADLRSEISNLKEKERNRLQAVATLPLPTIIAGLRERLGENAFAPRASVVADPGLTLTDDGLRQIETAFIGLDACRGQSHAQDGLLANCRGQAAAGRAVIEEINRSLAGLKEALRLKDEISARTEAAHRADLKAARGGRLKRFGRALEYVGAGVVIGVVVAQ